MTTTNGYLLADGKSLSRYALACGYVQSEQHGSRRVELYADGATFHVKGHDYAETPHRRFWDIFDPDDLTSARKRYREALKWAKL